MLGDQVYMARVTPTVEDIADKSKWEFYAGGHGADAKWVTGDVSAAKPLVDWCVNATHLCPFCDLPPSKASLTSQSQQLHCNQLCVCWFLS